MRLTIDNKLARSAGLALALINLIVVLTVLSFRIFGLPGFVAALMGKKTVDAQLARYGASTRIRIEPYFKTANLTYPPAKLVFIGLKKEKVLQVYGSDNGAKFVFVHQYPILAASGVLGPKLKEGDWQVPEGEYAIEALQPATPYHLALRVGYPNAEEKQHGAKEGRANLGGDIMIHGSACSAGCLAMGDEAAEDLFVMVADTKKENLQVLLCPLDFRKQFTDSLPTEPGWIVDVYSRLQADLKNYPIAR